MNKDTVMSIIFKGIINFLISIVLSNDSLHAFFTSKSGSYLNWLVIKCSLIAIFLYLAYQIVVTIVPRLKSWPKWRAEKHGPFRTKWIVHCARWAFNFIPVLIGGFLFVWYWEIQYHFGRFDDDEIGVLIAEFREVALDEYLPQGTFSKLIKQELHREKLVCSINQKLSFFNTSAFFLDRDEAQDFCSKVNAKIVIWGEVYKSEGVIRIVPRIAPAQIFNILSTAMPSDTNRGIDIIADHYEDWNIAGAPISLDSLKHFFNGMTLFSSFLLSKTRGSSPESVDSLAACILAHFGGIAQGLEPFFLAERALRVHERGFVDSAKYFYSLAEQKLSRVKSRISYSDLRATWLQNIGNIYVREKRDDSARHYYRLSFDLVPTIDSHKRAVLFAITYLLTGDYLTGRGILERSWQQRKDSTTGIWIAKISNHLSMDLSPVFLSEYDHLFGGRLLEQQSCLIRIVEPNGQSKIYNLSTKTLEW